MVRKSTFEKAKYLFDNTKCALLVIDCENDFCHPDGVLPKGGAWCEGIDTFIENVQEMIDLCHKAEIPVIFIKHKGKPEWLSEAQKFFRGPEQKSTLCTTDWGCELYKLKPGANDIYVEKSRYSAFIHTHLETVLHTLGIQTLIAVGTSTNCCVESTVRDGFMLDYHCMVIPDCCHSSISQAQHDAALINFDQRFATLCDLSDAKKILA